MTLVLKPEGDWLEKVQQCFEADEPVALPTETVYGLAAPINRPKALAKIFELKNRPNFNPLIIHVKKDWDLLKWVKGVTEIERALTQKFWPGPLSLLLPNSSVPDICTASSPFVVVRSPNNKIFESVLDYCKVPLAAPSANTTTRLSPTTVMRVNEDLGARGLSAIVDGGRTSEGVESTIIQVVGEKLRIMREGAVTLEDFESNGFSINHEMSYPFAPTPGQGKHYAPSVPLILMDEAPKWVAYQSNKNVLFLKILETDAPGLVPFNKKADVRVLSQSDLKEAAYELFETLRKAEKEYEQIVVLKTKEQGLGRAINDRLKRATEY